MKIPNNKFTRYWWGLEKSGVPTNDLNKSWLSKMFSHVFVTVLLTLVTYSIWNIILLIVLILIGLFILASYLFNIEMIPIEEKNTDDIIQEVISEKKEPLIELKYNNMVFQCDPNNNCINCNNQNCSIKIRLNN